MAKNGSKSSGNADPRPILDAEFTVVSGAGVGDGETDRESADQRWVDALAAHHKKVTRVQVCWRVGSVGYEPIEGLTGDLKPYSEDNTDDPRNENPAKWARLFCDALWKKAWEWAERDHTKYIDAQLVGQEFSDSKGAFVTVKGCKISCQMKFKGASLLSLSVAEGGLDPRDALLVHLLGWQERKELRDTARDANIDKIFAGAGRAIDTAFAAADKAIARSETLSAADLQDRKESRDLLKQIVGLDVISRNLGAAIKEVAPGINDLLKNWNNSSKTISPPYAKMAKELLDSITKAQIETLEKENLGTALADMRSVLVRLTEDGTDEEKAAICRPLAKFAINYQQTVGPLLTTDQRGLIAAILRKAGLGK